MRNLQQLDTVQNNYSAKIQPPLLVQACKNSSTSTYKNWYFDMLFHIMNNTKKNQMKKMKASATTY